jgi:SAM-dependent methyltransferase
MAQERFCMPSTVENHYAELLADHYHWMFGVPFETKVAEQTALLQESIGPSTCKALALDLGCGSGFQTVALADLGYRVVAVDTCEKLLDGLRRRVGGREITTNHADICGLANIADPGSVDLIVCMGDTITHLPSRRDVADLLRCAARALRSDGSLVLTYRDLSATPLEGMDRFIFVHGDADRVMTCFLENSSDDSVIVNDLIHIRGTDGRWTLHKSNYSKLKLSTAWLEDTLRQSGLRVTESRAGRMILIVAKKSDTPSAIV